MTTATLNKPNCLHLTYHYEEQEGDPMHPGDNRPRLYVLAICDDCDEDITELVGDFDPEFEQLNTQYVREE